MASPDPTQSDAQIVLDALPAKGLLAWVVDVQAKTRVRMTRPRVVAALKHLEAEGLVVHRAPFDVGRPDRWGRA